MMLQETLRCRFFQRAFGWCVPIGALGGLVGLGGGEFRLPEGFRPTRVLVAVLPDSGAVPKIEDEFEWAKVQGT